MKKKPSHSSSRDFDSPTHLSDSPHSPLRFHSPLRSDLGDPADTPPYASPAASPHHPPPAPPPPKPAPDAQKPLPPAAQAPAPGKESPGESGSAEESPDASPPPAMVLSRAMREEGTAQPPLRVRSMEGGTAARARTMRVRPWERLKQAGLCFRVAEVVLCMISFSVMAADKTKGWSGDSFDRYKEYRSGRRAMELKLCELNSMAGTACR
ncbi:hypothetical protein BT93_B0180 [Corymbia citriodora subsp. variegata]|nr:hypothetical protein BT93_B0180 [Corymbia citriodora subsp. variegata]